MIATTYTLSWSRYPADSYKRIRIDAVKFDAHQMPISWAIRYDGSVLNKNGEWEWEPQPSSRDDDFINRTRFDTAQEAADFALKFKYIEQ